MNKPLSGQPLSGKTAFVTGGSRGIGAAIVERLAADGADVTFTYAQSAETAEALVATITDAGGKARAVQVDSADAEALAAAIDEAAESVGSLDILVNNAGILMHGVIDDFSIEDFDRMVSVNIRAVFAGSKTAARHMQAGGRIITIGSVVADRAGMAGSSVYAMTKGAVAALNRGLARDLGPRGITVNTIQPGPTRTAMAIKSEEMLKPMLPVGRLGETAEIAALAAFLAGTEAAYVNGAALTIDGGFLA